MKRFIKIISLILAVVFVFSACGGNGNNETSTTSSADVSDNTRQKVKFTMEDGGEFIIALYPEYAPETVENFVNLVSVGFYNGLTFHRVIDNFMAQGGDPEGTGSGGSGKDIVGEFSINGFTQNTLSHKRGVVSMARNGYDFNSASSQFFICYDDRCVQLDGQYAAFGEVIEGMEVVDSFLEVERVYDGNGDKSIPVEPIVIEKAEVLQ